MEWLLSVLIFLFAYLIGALPIAQGAALFVFKDDLNTISPQNGTSKQPAGSVLKIKQNILSFVLNAGKGLLVVFTVRQQFPADFYLLLSATGGVVLGDVHPIWKKFKGSFGLAVAAGAFFLINPYVILLWLFLFGIYYLPLRQTVIASLVATFCLPLVVFFTRHIYFTDNILLLILPVSMLIFQRFLNRIPLMMERVHLKIKNGEI